MTKAEEKAFNQFVAYVRDNFKPDAEDAFQRMDILEEFSVQVYRVNPKCPSIYAIEPFAGVFL